MPTEVKKQGYFEKLIEGLLTRSLPVPPVLLGEVKPLAYSTRQDLQPWCELHGYDEADIKQLNAAIGVHVRSGAYKRALMVDLSERHDLDGRAISPVSELDRHSAAMSMYVLLRKDEAAAERMAAEKREAEKPVAPAPQKEGPVFRPNGAPLTAEEVQQRRQALQAGLRPRAAP